MNSPKKTWFAFPYILWIIGFTLIPLGLVLYYAFTGADGSFTLANVLAITEPVHLKSLWTSLKMAFLTTLICFILAYPLGLVLCSLNLKKSNFIIFLFILPMWMNFLLRTMAWQLILSNNGVLNTLLGFLHLPKVHIIYTFQAVLIGMVYDFLPSQKPAIGALGIYMFMSMWNNFMWPLIILSTKSMYNFPVALAMLDGVAWRKDYGVVMLATVCAVLPIMIIFLIFQKQFVAGVMGGAVKE